MPTVVYIISSHSVYNMKLVINCKTIELIDIKISCENVRVPYQVTPHMISRGNNSNYLFEKWAVTVIGFLTTDIRRPSQGLLSTNWSTDLGWLTADMVYAWSTFTRPFGSLIYGMVNVATSINCPIVRIIVMQIILLKFNCLCKLWFARRGLILMSKVETITCYNTPPPPSRSTWRLKSATDKFEPHHRCQAQSDIFYSRVH